MRFQKVSLAFLTLLAVLFCLRDGKAESRVALVIGNSKYQTLKQLENPARDAELVASALEKNGFEKIIRAYDLDRDQFVKKLQEFERLSDNADLALVYYAGHGVEVDGKNYLVPVDGAVSGYTSINRTAISMGRVLVAMEGAKQLRILVLDACRENPFIEGLPSNIESRSAGRGLGNAEPERISADQKPNGQGETLIAYAAKHGEIALDGSGRNSPFAAAFAHRLEHAGLEIRKFFSMIRDDVLKSTSGKQEPFTYASMSANEYFLNQGVVWSRLLPREVLDSDARDDFGLAITSNTIAGWDLFLAENQSGPMAELARRERARLVELLKAAPSPDLNSGPVDNSKTSDNMSLTSKDQPANQATGSKPLTSNPSTPKNEERWVLLEQKSIETGEIVPGAKRCIDNSDHVIAIEDNDFSTMLEMSDKNLTARIVMQTDSNTILRFTNKTEEISASPGKISGKYKIARRETSQTFELHYVKCRSDGTIHPIEKIVTTPSGAAGHGPAP